MSRPYVLITAAHNEEVFIERTVTSIVSQKHLPEEWIIVSDGSTDRTDQIVLEKARKHDFIRLVSVPIQHRRDFVSKVQALHAGYQHIRCVNYEFIGILDADVSLHDDYYSAVLDRFDDPKLGIAGGFIYESHDGGFRPRKSNSDRSVPGAVQLFRRKCYEEIGGVQALKHGGEDWCAEVSARMKGWEVRAFPDCKVFHHRATGSADPLLAYCFRQGRMDFALGAHPLFELVKCTRRFWEKPIGMGIVARLGGFTWSYLSRENRAVSPEFVAFLRREQVGRLLVSFMPWRCARDNQSSRPQQHQAARLT